MLHIPRVALAVIDQANSNVTDAIGFQLEIGLFCRNDRRPPWNALLASNAAILLSYLGFERLPAITKTRNNFDCQANASGRWMVTFNASLVLRGHYQAKGWWYYYLYAILVKTPLGTLGLIALAFALRFTRLAPPVP